MGNPLHGDFILWQVQLLSAALSIVQVEKVITLCLSVCSLIVGYIHYLHSGSINARTIDFFKYEESCQLEISLRLSLPASVHKIEA